MRLGVDFGTTHTVVALIDRGNYPAVAFEGGDPYPSLIAQGPSGELRFGFDAAAVRHEPGWTLLRSFKRLLSDAGPATAVEIAGRRHVLFDLVVAFLAHVRRDLEARSNAGIETGERLEAAISVPANSSSAQRFLTMEAFRAAGFDVAALLNEPSAAGFEYAHRFRNTITSRREYVLVYDLGGGTFDASLLKMTGRANEVVTSEGVRRLGGDDFDEAILELVLEKAGLTGLSGDPRDVLLEECARQKEAVGPQTRRFVVDLAAVERPPLAIPIDEVYRVCEPLVQATLEAMDPAMRDPERDGDGAVDWNELAGIYIVGGAGTFPLVPRLLRERYGEKRVKRSPHPFAATAMGLALHLDGEAGYTLSERFSRHFGVFREAAEGTDVVFDPIFEKGLLLPGEGEPPLVAVRRYRPAHNVGHFRFVECSRLTSGRPDGDVTPWDEVRFPFAPELRQLETLEAQAVVRTGAGGAEVEERYACHPSGAVEVTLRVPLDGFARTFRIGRHPAG